MKVAGEEWCSTLKRSLCLLYPLETRTEHVTSTTFENVEVTGALDTKQAGSPQLKHRRWLTELASEAEEFHVAHGSSWDEMRINVTHE